MKVLSVFDGMSCGRIALERIERTVNQYFASEIDKYAIQVSRKNYPDIIQLGDVRIVREMAQCGVFGRVDLLMGGSPCQGFSFAGKQLAFDDPRSALFFEYVWILEALRRDNPDIKFLLENVRMKKEHLAVITDMLGVEPVFINSALVSAQNRQRYYWCNWAVPQPEDKGLLLRDIIEDGPVDREKSYCIDANYYKGGSVENYKMKVRRQIVGVAVTKNGIRPYKNDGRKGSISEIGTIGLENGKSAATTVAHVPKIAFCSDEKRLMVRIADIKNGGIGNRVYSTGGKGAVLTAQSGGTAGSGNMLVTANNITYRKLTPIECERLQTVPDNYTAGVSNTQRYKMLGNGWTVDVIAHILRCMP